MWSTRVLESGHALHIPEEWVSMGIGKAEERMKGRLPVSASLEPGCDDLTGEICILVE